MQRLSINRTRYSGFFLLALTALSWSGFAQSEDIRKLKALSMEELMNIEVMAVTRGPQLLSEAASAIQVITREDIRRSGATNIPEALRLAPNLQVAQLNASAWIISARGFNTVFANKLLVLIDGRTVYTPLFAGVLWELQHVLLEDVDRIEVISGPGASLWGANAVNGVINIITKSSKDTQGVFASGAVGTLLNTQIAARYGGQISEKVHFRIFDQYTRRASFVRPSGREAKDNWYVNHLGARVDITPNEKDVITVQGDYVTGVLRPDSLPGHFDGENILGRWNRKYSERSDFTLQVYFDRYWRDDPNILADELTTYDADFQHRLILPRNKLVWGLGYRLVDDDVINRQSAGAGLVPASRRMPLYSAFIQDEFSALENLKFTVGTRFLHNVFSGFEFQPTTRVAWTFNAVNTLWAAASRAVRAPSRFDVDYFLPTERQPPSVPSVAGGPNFTSEKLMAYELGFRSHPGKNFSLSISGFYNRYRDVYSVEPLPNTLTYTIQNGSEAESRGLEVSGLYEIVPGHWRLRAGYSYLDVDLRAKEGRTHDPSYLANDAKHRVLLQSIFDLPSNISVDLTARFVDGIPASFATAAIPEYYTLDARVAWELQNFELAVVGQNLLEEYHAEFGTLQVPRSVYGKLSFRW